MNYDVFLEEIEAVKELSIEEQKAFFVRILEQEQAKSNVRLHAYFAYALLFYHEGNFHRAREILERFIVNYQSYEYIPRMVSCFNLMGVCYHCEREFVLARFFYEKSIEIAKAHDAYNYFSFEYNNLALTYIEEQNYEKAQIYIALAEQYLPECNKAVGVYVYLNKAAIYHNLNQLEEALLAFEKCGNAYQGFKMLTEDMLVCGLFIFYKRGEKEKYEEYKKKIFEKLDTMYASEFMSACRAVFECALDARDYALVEQIIEKMDVYALKNPHERKVCLSIEELKYIYAKKLGNKDAMLLSLEKKNAYYEQIVEESEKQRTKALAQFLEANEQLQKVMENEARANHVKTQFLANMSHDIRTPINGIMGMLDVIQKSRDNDEKVDDCLKKIDVSSKHLLLLVNDVLDMTKLEADAIVLEQKPFQLKRAYHEVKEVIFFQAKEAGLSIYEEQEEIGERNLLGSEIYLKKILVNLFDNSIKYNKPGGSIYTSLREVSCTKDRIYYEFKIRDTGIGMTREFIEKQLFEPFVQASNAARSKYAGTGLGMSIVAQLVKKMNGTIEVESTLGEGSCFTLILPFAIDCKPSQKKALNVQEANIRGKHLLVAEDNELNMEIAEFVLTEAGAIVYKAENGKVALEMYQKAETGTYDAILMDLMMPVMDGYEAADAIRKSEKTDAKTIPIIAMSANAYAEDVKKCLEIGMNAHLSKPLSQEVLVAKVAKYLS